MTSFAFILGVLPLAIASGPGAEMRQSLGTAVFSGMLGVTLFGLFLTPVFYVLLSRSRARGAVAVREHAPPSAAGGPQASGPDTAARRVPGAGASRRLRARPQLPPPGARPARGDARPAGADGSRVHRRPPVVGRLPRPGTAGARRRGDRREPRPPRRRRARRGG